MSKPLSWTMRDNGLPDWAVTAAENIEREAETARADLQYVNEMLSDALGQDDEFGAVRAKAAQIAKLYIALETQRHRALAAPGAEREGRDG